MESPLYRMTWKERVTPSGRRILARVGSAPRTYANACTSWGTPRTFVPSGVSLEAWEARNARCKAKHGRGMGKPLELQALMASWPTCRANDATGAKTPPGSQGGPALKTAAELASWPTPAAKEAGGTPEQFLARKEKAKAKGDKLGISLTSLNLMASLAGWPSTTVSDANNTRNSTAKRSPGAKKGKPGNTLVDAADFASWPTTTTRDHKDGAADGTVEPNGLLGRVAWDAKGAIRITASGQILTGLDAGMESGGRLNPAFSRWLMGLPTVWDDCADTVTRSLRRSRKNS